MTKLDLLALQFLDNYTGYEYIVKGENGKLYATARTDDKAIPYGASLESLQLDFKIDAEPMVFYSITELLKEGKKGKKRGKR